MATIIKLHSPQKDVSEPGHMTNQFNQVLAKAKKGQIEPLTPVKLRKRPGLENITDEEAVAAIAAIKKLAAIFFATACHKQPPCIENQQVVSLIPENKAA